VEETRTCTKCSIVKPISAFSFRKERGYHRTNCKDCHNLTTFNRKADHRKENVFDQVCKRKKSHCKHNGKVFELTKEYLRSLWDNQSGKCAVLGIEIDLYAPNFEDNKATLDQIIPNQGYTIGNVAWVSWLANRIKSNCTDPEVFLKVADYVRETNLKEQPEFDFSFPN
jgi:hypothetical protein